MSYPGIAHISEEEPLRTRTVSKPGLGTLGMTEDGRLFRFTENGGVATVASELQQAFVPETDTLAETIATLAAGVTVLTGIGATAGSQAANLFKHGYAFSPTSADLNPVYRIKSNTLITAAAETGTITLYSPTVAAFAAASTISYIRNLWKDTIVAVATNPTAMVLGVAVRAVAVDAFGWIQSRGVASVLCGNTTYVIGDPVGPGTDAGSAIPIAATELTVPVYGTVVVAAANTVTGLIYLQID